MIPEGFLAATQLEEYGLSGEGCQVKGGVWENTQKEREALEHI